MTCIGTELVAAASQDVGNPTDFGIPGAFCSIAVQQWLRTAAANADSPMPIPGSPGAKAMRDQFQAKGWWVDAATARANPQIISPGMVAVWHRGEPGACTGHTGVVVGSVTGNTFSTVEANAAPKVSRFNRDINADNLLGFGWFPCATQPSPFAMLQTKTNYVPWVVAGGLAVAAFYAYRKGLLRLPLHQR